MTLTLAERIEPVLFAKFGAERAPDVQVPAPASVTCLSSHAEAEIAPMGNGWPLKAMTSAPISPFHPRWVMRAARFLLRNCREMDGRPPKWHDRRITIVRRDAATVVCTTYGELLKLDDSFLSSTSHFIYSFGRTCIPVRGMA